MLTRVALACVMMLRCHGDDPGFDVVRVPQSAYAAPDGATHADAAREGDAAPDAYEPIVVCIPEESDPGEDEPMSPDYSSCPLKHEDRLFDARATERHRKRDDESSVCCYRKH